MRSFCAGLLRCSVLLGALVYLPALVRAQEAAPPAEAAAPVEAPPAETAPEEAAEAAKTWDAMSVDEKLAALKDASLKTDDAGTVTSTVYADADTLWTCIAAFLVFFMQAGFATVEAGFTRAKNTCNILMKNLLDFCLGSVAFWIVGFGLMFGATYHNLVGTNNFFFDPEVASPDKVSFGWAFLIFQTVFCATAATIVSGAMAERTKFSSYLIYTVFITAIVYPVFGSWAWGNLWQGGGWLAERGFHDFAGSTVVHSIGGWAALAGALVVGPRIGKFVNGKAMPIPGHSIPLGAIGVFILWLGWFGFNPGSTTAVGNGNFAFIAVTTNIAAAGGAIGAMLASWIAFKKPDVSFTLNGTLAGLVAITAGCDIIPVPYALLTGFLAGVLVVGACVFFDKIRIDDPVGAISVHGVCGCFGTICVGLFAKEIGLVHGGGVDLLVTQLIGCGAAFVWSFSVSGAIFLLIKATLGLRVSDLEQIEGLDLHEHGMSAYPPGWIANSETTSVSPVTGGSMFAPGAAVAPAGGQAMAT